MATITKTNKTKKMVTVAMFCALAYICVFIFRFKVSFLTFDVKDAVITMGAMFCGPLSAIVISFIVALIEMITVSDTELYGMVMNFISSATFSLIASFIYTHKRSLNGAIVGLFAAVASMTGVMMAANLIITPFYMHVTVSEVAALIPTLLLPFNFTKSLFNMALVLLLYKPVSNALKRSRLVEKESADYNFDIKSVLTLCLGAVLLIVSLLVFILVLNGEITFFRS